MKTRHWIGLIILLMAFLLGACKPTDPMAKPTDQLDDIRTVAARTIEALTTQMMQTSESGQTETPLPPLETETGPNFTEEATEELSPTPIPSDEVTDPATELTPTDEKPCDRAFFLGETVYDGSQLYPGTVFEKTWTLRNEGSCTWTPDYSVVFISGDSMSAPAVVQLSDKEVKPGETVVVKMPLVAPTIGGRYRGNFKLRNAAGVLFAFKNPEQTFWADIEVVEGVIHLAGAYCSAQWRSGAGDLPCPSQPSDAKGYVYADNAPVLETGGTDDELALWLGVQPVTDGYIMGTYPAMTIPNNAQFTTVLGCGHNLPDCRIKFVLAYQVGDEPIQQLGSWDEDYDGAFQKISLDLSHLGGRTVKIVLIARAMGFPESGRIHLLEPVIKP